MEPLPKNSVSLDILTALCKRRGFIFQSAEIYGGLNGFYDIGHLGVLLKNNLREAWKSSLYNNIGEVVLLEGSIIGPEAMWQASGHIEHFHDPMVDCLKCKHRFRADQINLDKACPNCGNKQWTDVRNFNMMLKTTIGASEQSGAIGYLRPETAQSIFVNFKNVLSTARVKIPFGIAQIGKAFRNEITPRQFLFRMREFEQMEVEWFCKAENAQEAFNLWRTKRMQFYSDIGINMEKIRLRSHEKDELSHYSSGTDDIEYHFPFGWKELEGIAHRTNFDLTQHSKYSGKDLAVFDEETKQSYIPDVVECSVGTDRLLLTLLFDSYKEDIVEGETRNYFAFAPHIAPIKAAFFPLVKKLEEPMNQIYQTVKAVIPHIQFDVSGSIGKRYRRQDEIGTPFCFTYDFESEATQTVTVRHRDSTKQERISISDIIPYITKAIHQKKGDMYIHRRVYKWTESFVHTKHAEIALVLLFYLEALLFILPTDAMLIVYCIEHSKKAFWYAFIATIASVLGGITGYLIGYLVWQSMGEAIIYNTWVNYILKPTDFYYLCQLYNSHEYIAIFIAGFTPIPYKAATLTAGFCQLSFIPFVICSLLARGARFFIYAITITIWGKQIKEYIDRFFDQLVVLILIIALFSIWLYTY